jgi:pimeloyl-ACP methyl ester carboxylesterase
MMTPPKATTLLRNAITSCKVVEIDNCGHSLMAEQPDAVLESLFSFCRQP